MPMAINATQARERVVPVGKRSMGVCSILLLPLDHDQSFSFPSLVEHEWQLLETETFLFFRCKKLPRTYASGHRFREQLGVRLQSRRRIREDHFEQSATVGWVS